MKRHLLNVALALGSICVTLFLLEQSAAFLYPRVKLQHGSVACGIGGMDVSEYPYGYIKDRELFWRMEPRWSDCNARGLRGKEFLPKKTKGVFRIICMGDSVTYGWPSPADKTYPATLERLLNARFSPARFEVLNAGVPGYTSYQGLRWLRKELITYQPDMIIAYYGINDRTGCDIQDKDQKMPPVWLVRTVNYVKKYYVYRLLSKVMFFVRYPVYKMSGFAYHRVSSSDFRNNVRAMAREAGARGCKVLYVSGPVLYLPQEDVVITDERYRVDPDLPRVNMYEVFKNQEAIGGELFLDDFRPINFHLTIKGQELFARKVLEYLVTHNVIAQ